MRLKVARLGAARLAATLVLSVDALANSTEPCGSDVFSNFFDIRTGEKGQYLEGIYQKAVYQGTGTRKPCTVSAEACAAHCITEGANCFGFAYGGLEQTTPACSTTRWESNRALPGMGSLARTPLHESAKIVLRRRLPRRR